MQYSNKYNGRITAADAKGTNTDSEESYRCLFEQATDLIIIHDMTGVIVNVNDSLCSRLGFTRDEMLHMSMQELIDPEQQRLAPLRWKELSEGKRIFSERRYICKDGSFVEIEANVKKMANNLVMGVARDVTERKRMERELREAEIKFRTISERSLVGIYIYQDGRFAYVNPKFADIFGYPSEELLSISVDLVADAEDRERVNEYIRLRMAGEENHVHYEAKGRKKDGTLIYVEVFGSRSVYNDRVAIIGSLIDITERRLAEEEVKRERNLSNEIIDCLPGVFFLQDANGKYLRWNKQFGKESGYSQEEIKDLNCLDFFEGDHQKAAIQEKINRLFSDPNGEIDIELEVTTRDGRKLPFYYKAKHISYEGQPCIMGAGYNISSLKEAEEKAKESEANLHTILDNTDTIYALLDKNLRIVSYNQRAKDFARKELGHDMYISDRFLDYFPSGRKDAITKWMAKVMAGEMIQYEVSYPQAEGSFTWYHVRMIPITNSNNELQGLMAATSDITQKKLLELEILNQKIQQQKKITRAVIQAQETERTKIGQELHDNVNQILATSRIYMNTALAAKLTGKEELVLEAIELIDNAIEELRLLARNEISPQGKHELPELILPLINDLNDKSAIRARFDYRIDIPYIDADLKLNIYRIIQEQISNIIKHAQATAVHIVLDSDDGYINVDVEDNGKGFELSDNRKGIGITNIINRIESFNGDYALDSSPGKGCRLSVRFPAA
jgi:PAS domain S-box-containing protein